MPSRRVLKAAEAIREVVGMAILADLKDPRIKNVTVTFVEVAGDMRQAKVHVSIMGTEAEQQLCLYGLQSSAGFLQKKISNRIDTRYTPRIEFVIDEGVKKSIEITRILREVLPDDAATGAAGSSNQASLAETLAAESAEIAEEDDGDEDDIEDEHSEGDDFEERDWAEEEEDQAEDEQVER